MADTRLLNRDERLALRTTLRELLNAQGYALNAAAVSIEVVTAETDGARSDVAQQFRTFRDLYAKSLRTLTEAGGVLRRTLQGRPRAEALLQTLHEVDARLQALEDVNDFVGVAAVEAGRLVSFVRLQGVPALMEISAILSGVKKSHEAAVKEVMEGRIARLDKMFTEVEDIGRMIHLISLNASVEAARAGGESGRSFKVIADEIRGLAQQASDLIDKTREGVLTGHDSDTLSLRAQ